MTLHDIWQRLQAVNHLQFESHSRADANTGWNGHGSGVVRIEFADSASILFHESGSWTQDSGPEIAFQNVFRWTINAESNFIRLEHLRFGPNRPVHLLDLALVGEGPLEAAEPHVCGPDNYDGRLQCGPESMQLHWTVTGPKKYESIAYTYW